MVWCSPLSIVHNTWDQQSKITKQFIFTSSSDPPTLAGSSAAPYHHPALPAVRAHKTNPDRALAIRFFPFYKLLLSPPYLLTRVLEGNAALAAGVFWSFFGSVTIYLTVTRSFAWHSPCDWIFCLARRFWLAVLFWTGFWVSVGCLVGL